MPYLKTFSRVHPTPILFALVALLPKGITAQTPPTFSVSVTERSELIEDVGTTRRVDRAEIEARNARTLDEALRLVPGIYVRTGGDGTPRIDVRGFRSRHVLLLMNGVQINSTSDGQFDPARISTDSIREIKISYGSSSILYGDNALAAVIEITTVDETPDRTLNVSAGTTNQWGGGARYAQTLGKWSLTASGTGFTTDGFRLPDSFPPTSQEDGARRANSDRDRGEFRGTVGYRISSAASLASEWSFGTGNYGIPPSTINDSTNIFAQAPRYERVEDYDAMTGQVSFTVAPWRRFNLQTWVYRNRQHEDRARYDDATYSSMDNPLAQGTFESSERTTVTGTSALGRLDLSRYGWLRLAFNQRRELLDSGGVIRDVVVGGTPGGGGGGGGGGRGTTTQPTTYGVRWFALDHHVDVYSTGAEWQVRPVPRFGTVLGGAWNVQQRPEGTTEREPTWIAGVTFEASAATRVFASATRKIRVPSIDQLFDATAGNPELRAERATGVEVGVSHQVGKASSVAVSAFTTQARDFIERDAPDPFENNERYRFRGAEVMAETARLPRLNLRGSYSFLDSDDLKDGSESPLQTRPRHRGNIEWDLTPYAQSTVRGAVSWTGAQLFDSRGANLVQFLADPYTLVDLGFTQTLAGRYDLALDVTNLFDTLYEQGYGLPREGRTALITLRARMR